MGFSETPLCSYCDKENETIQHLFLDCSVSKALWHDIKVFFSSIIDIPDLDLQSAILGFIDSDKDNRVFNNILLIYKLCLYRFRDKKVPNLQLFLKNLKEREFLERQIVQFDDKKLLYHHKKWEFLKTMVN